MGLLQYHETIADMTTVLQNFSNDLSIASDDTFDRSKPGQGQLVSARTLKYIAITPCKGSKRASQGNKSTPNATYLCAEWLDQPCQERLINVNTEVQLRNLYYCSASKINIEKLQSNAKTSLCQLYFRHYRNR